MEKRKDNKNRVLKEGEYQRKNGTYEYKWKGINGKRNSIYARTLGELREKEKEILKNQIEGIRVDNKNLTLNDIFEIWKKIKKGIKDNTYRNYIYMYEQFAYEKIGKYKIYDLRKSDIKKFYNYLIETRNLKLRTVECIHTVIYQVLQIAQEDNYIRINPASSTLKEFKKAYNCDYLGKRALTIEEQNIFIEYISNPENIKWYPIFVFMLWTGLRVGEVTGLRWEDIDFEKNIININHTLVYYSSGKHKECIFSINTPKTKSSMRTIPMLPIAKKALLMERDNQKLFNIKSVSKIAGFENFIFVNRYGNVQHQGTLNKALRRIVRDCNLNLLEKNRNMDEITILPNISCHTFRKTFTTRMCESGVNIKVIQKILGHKDVETTLNIYADATEDFKQLEIKKLDKFTSEH